MKLGFFHNFEKVDFSRNIFTWNGILSFKSGGFLQKIAVFPAKSQFIQIGLKIKTNL